ncbi:MmyB family transcriptional regulator [Streptomyces griseoluteus]|uniref:MmyB family transcriptional regulator n=1 Tax=Streptomyces griseoluteus TaxID=29306 RepID=UPI00382A65A6
MAHQAGGRRPVTRSVPESCEARDYLEDYAAVVEAAPFPSFVVDHRWNVILANGPFAALFGEVRHHPTAMPGDNFLRFVLFHPDAGRVLGEHEPAWCLPMLAQLKAAMEGYGHDQELQAIRRDVAHDPIMEAAYRQGLPHWIRAVGESAARLDGAVRLLHHPDPRRGTTACRVVDETPPLLRDLGHRRLTMIPRQPSAAGRRAHLTVVPTS